MLFWPSFGLTAIFDAAVAINAVVKYYEASPAC